MAQKYRSYSARRIIRKSRRNLIITSLLIIFLLYATINWILPGFVNILGTINNIIKQPSKINKTDQLNSTLAPPVLTIPYEATNSPDIDIGGYSNPNSKVKIFVDEKEVKTADVLDDGSFLAKEIALSPGTNNIFSKSVDEENRESLPSKTYQIIMDLEKPPLSISEPEDNKTISGDRKLKISGKTEPNAQIFINDSQIIVGKDGNFSKEVELSDGDNIFNIKSIDHASNFEEVSRKVIFQPN